MPTSVGCIDIYGSRRTEYEFCKFWKRDESTDVMSDSDMVHKRDPSGVFYAKEENPEDLHNNVVDNSFLFDESTITVKTNDDVSSLTAQDIVQYDGRIWNVRAVQRKKVKKRSEFSNTPQYITYISIKCN